MKIKTGHHADEPAIFRMSIEAVIPGHRANCTQCGTDMRKSILPEFTTMDRLFHVQVGRTKRCLCLGCLLEQMQDENLYRYPFKIK